MNAIIRSATLEDSIAIYRIEELAFGHSAEANLTKALRAKNAYLLSLVAEIEGQIVGHILFSMMRLQLEEPTGFQGAIAGLGPIAVQPSYQKRGIGSQLVRAGLQQSHDRNYNAIVLLGDPAYYGRFGFEAAQKHGLRCQYDVPHEAFQIIELRPGALKNANGLLLYRPEFDGV